LCRSIERAAGKGYCTTFDKFSEFENHQGRGLPINGYYANLFIMRVFLMLLIFAIGFSGYSAAAHAFGHQSCDPAMMMQIEDASAESPVSTDMPDCPEHQSYQNLQKNADTEKVASKDKCMDCTQCCTSQLMSLHDFKGVFLPRSSVLEPTYVDFLHIGDFLYSLKRPPKISRLI
jgi:hypothetical protein